MLQAALTDPQTAKLPLIKGLADPVGWLEEHLQAEFLQQSEIMRLSMVVTDDQTKEGEVILKSVIEAYLQEAAAAEQIRLQREYQIRLTEYQALRDRSRKLAEKVADLRSKRGAEDSEADLLDIEAAQYADEADRAQVELSHWPFAQQALIPSVRLIQPPVVSP